MTKITARSIPTLSDTIQTFLEDHKIFDITLLSLAGKTAMAEMFIIASGRSQRHIRIIAEMLKDHLKHQNAYPVLIEGLPNSDWILVDAGDVVVHLFKPESRSLYDLEKIWN